MLYILPIIKHLYFFNLLFASQIRYPLGKRLVKQSLNVIEHLEALIEHLEAYLFGFGASYAPCNVDQVFLGKFITKVLSNG